MTLEVQGHELPRHPLTLQAVDMMDIVVLVITVQMVPVTVHHQDGFTHQAPKPTAAANGKAELVVGSQTRPVPPSPVSPWPASKPHLFILTPPSEDRSTPAQKMEMAP